MTRYKKLTFWNKVFVWGSIASLLGVLGIPLAIYIYCASDTLKYSALKTDFNRLLKQSTDTEAVANAFRLKVEAVSASSDTAGRILDNPELKRLGKELREAANSFDSRYHSQLTPKMALEVRLVRGIAANAEGNFQAAQELVSDAELETETLHTAQMILIRADAELGLGQFSKAMDFYQRLIRIMPESARALLGVATCLRGLGHFREAILINTQIIALCEQGHLPIAQLFVASSLNNRGLAYIDLQEYSNAIADFSYALELARQSKSNSEYGLHDAVWLLLNNRGLAYCSAGLFTNALADHNLALSTSSSLKPNGTGDTDLHLAMLLINRANDYNKLMLFSNSITDSKKALSILEPVAANGHCDVSQQLATALMNRGIAYREVGLITNSLNELNRAINIWSNLIQGGRNELNIRLAYGLMNRTLSYVDYHQLDFAMTDCDRCIDILLRMASEGHTEVAALLARSLTTRGGIKYDTSTFTNALEDANQAIDILYPLFARGRTDVGDDLAIAYGNRGSCYLALQQLTNAFADYNRSIEMWDAFNNNRHLEEGIDLSQRLISRASVGLQFKQLTNYMRDCSWAINILEPLAKGQPTSLKVLGIALTYRACGYDQLGDRTNAINDYIRSIDILNRLVTSRQPEVTENLEKALFNCANNCRVVGQLTNSVSYYSRAIAIVQPMIEIKPELKSHLATTLKYRAFAYCAAGDIADAIPDLRSYEAMIEDLVHREGVASLGPEFEQALVMLGLVLTIDNKEDQAKPYLEKAIKVDADERLTKNAQALLNAQSGPVASQLRKILMDAMQIRSP